MPERDINRQAEENLASHGHPWHHEQRDATQGDDRMSIDELLRLSSLLLPAVVMWWLHIHLREIERDKQRVVRRQTDVLTLRAGDTVVGVMERDAGPSLFLTRRATERPHDA
jgi:hypothetical protein